jgi:hypothetical protein
MVLGVVLMSASACNKGAEDTGESAEGEGAEAHSTHRNGVDAAWCWIDSDGDGVGEGDDPSEGAIVEPDGGCPAGRVDVGGDCDDADPATFPGAPEVCDDGVDNDCNGADLPCP